MPTVKITDKGCRGCSLCVDECPVQVFERVENPNKAGNFIAKVSRSDDCMGCFACSYLCPSQCIHINGAEMQRPFHRVDENLSFVERFLGMNTTTRDLTEDDWEEAYKDVSMTLVSLAAAIEKDIGLGMGALGYQAGKRAVRHIPEIFEEQDLKKRLERLKKRFQDSFNFNFDIKGNGEIRFTFAPCSLSQIVKNNTQEKIGKAILCQLFHYFWAGLISECKGGINSDYKLEVAKTENCILTIFQN
jgi:2-oxoglutarate ferredoxin oxidoreductase subunit delta